MIRFFCLNTFIVLHTIVFSLWAIVLSVFERKGRLSHFYCGAPWAKTILWVCGVKVEVKGLKNVDSHVPRVYLTNHQSYFDILALFACLPVSFKFVVKEELMRIPLFGLAMKLTGHVAVDRHDYRKAVKSMNEAAEKIGNGVSMLIFPEGTRSEDGRLQPFKNGGFRLALKAGCDVVPMAIINSRSIVPKGSLRINKGTFGLHIGKPISVKDYSKKDIDKLMTRVRESMMSLMGGGN
jgi:1-acyl-sn-glycerol-3-phosphate acyltransferase